MSDLLYAREKFGSMVRTLACGPGRIQARLFDAVIEGHPGLTFVPPPEHPDLATKVLWINDQLTARKALAGEGNYAASINAMSEDEAIVVAQAIVDIDAELDFIWAHSETARR